MSGRNWPCFLCRLFFAITCAELGWGLSNCIVSSSVVGAYLSALRNFKCWGSQCDLIVVPIRRFLYQSWCWLNLQCWSHILQSSPELLQKWWISIPPSAWHPSSIFLCLLWGHSVSCNQRHCTCCSMLISLCGVLVQRLQITGDEGHLFQWNTLVTVGSKLIQ